MNKIINKTQQKKSRDQILSLITSDEPDYAGMANSWSKEDYKELNELATGPDIILATRAIICLGLMKSHKSLLGVTLAAQSTNPDLRVAAAQALRNLSKFHSGVELLDKLLDDDDIGVRKFALKSVEDAKISTLKDKVNKMSVNEETELMKKLAKKVMTNLEK